jgi:hypothetical protein
LQNGPRGYSTYEIAVRNGYEGTEEEWLNDPVNGAKPNGIKSIETIGTPSSEDGAINTYRITTDKDEIFDFNVKNGKGIASVEQTTVSEQDSGTNIATITFSDGTTKTVQFKNGSGIASIDSTTSHLDGGVNTITITTSDGRTKTVTFYNGNQGSSAAPNPDEVQIVNNRVDGGTTKAWSAEQGKLLCQDTLFLGTVVETL